MSNISDFDRILKIECNWQHFVRNCRIKNLDDFERDQSDAYLWIAGLLNMNDKGMMLHLNRSLVMFLRGRKVNIMQYWWNTIAKLTVNKWSLSKCLSNWNPKISMLYQNNYFVVSVKLNFGYSIDDQDDQDSLYFWSR